jgi:hypothetical protein
MGTTQRISASLRMHDASRCARRACRMRWCGAPATQSKPLARSTSGGAAASSHAALLADSHSSVSCGGVA